jgi:hypothetical protein
VRGYLIAEEALDLEIYTLAALVSGSPTLAMVGDEYSGLRFLRSTFEVSEVSRRLISVAIMLRSQLDSTGQNPDKPVGYLIADISNAAKKEPLVLREACNKLIHATSVDLTALGPQNPRGPALSHAIDLQGTHRDLQWEARVFLYDFLNVACSPVWRSA